MKKAELGAAQKAIIFTESRRTQDYLLRVLADSPLRTASFCSTARTPTTGPKRSTPLGLKHAGTDRVTGSRTADMRSALVDYFREQGRIMIATEAGAEGINLQFCSLVVNYDLPWNPQRIEQRIGRCHRYGQKHDVVVVNFLNRKNAADQRVFRTAVRKIPALRGRLWRERRSAGCGRERRGLREAHRRHLPALPQAGGNQSRLRPTPA